MSLYKNADNIWEADVRVVRVPRLHLSMRTRKKSEAQPRYDALRRLFREAKGPAGAGRRALIDQLRDGSLSIERLESMVAAGEPLVPHVDLATSEADWPTVDVAMERYLDWVKVNPNRRLSTWQTARAQLRKFVKFEVGGIRLGGLPLDRVTSAHIEAYQRSLIDAKVPPNSLTAYMTRIGGLWSWVQRRENRSAIETRRIAAVIHSPIDPETAARGVTRRDRWLTTEEAERLMAVTPDRFRFAVAAGVFGGLRIGEILHLRTHVDVDLTLGTIAIQEKQIGIDVSGAPVFWKPKTKRSYRVVPIAPDLRPILEEHLGRYSSDNWVTPAIGDATKPFAYDTFGHNFTTIVANAELATGRRDPRGVIFHTLRHTFASWLVMRGVDLYTVAQLLGDTLQMVENTYAHLAPDFKRRAIEALKGAILIPAAPDARTDAVD